MFKFTVLAILLCGASQAVLAETNLAMLCDGTPKTSRLNDCAQLKWGVPTDQSFTASCISTCTWNSADAQWRKFGELPQGAKVLRCSKDVPAVSFRAGIAGVDPCPDSLKAFTADPSQLTRVAKWKAPSTNVDGSVLTDLAGYRLSVGEGEQGPWRVAALPAATSLDMVVTVAVTAVERCAQLVARTGAGDESKPKTACIKGAPPNAGEDFTFE